MSLTISVKKMRWASTLKSPVRKDSSTLASLAALDIFATSGTSFFRKGVSMASTSFVGIMGSYSSRSAS